MSFITRHPPTRPRARSYGFETENDCVGGRRSPPSAPDAGYDRAYYVSFPNAESGLGTTGDLSGATLPNSPKWTLHADSQYTRNFGADQSGFLRLEWHYKGGIVSDQNSRVPHGIPVGRALVQPLEPAGGLHTRQLDGHGLRRELPQQEVLHQRLRKGLRRRHVHRAWIPQYWRQAHGPDQIETCIGPTSQDLPELSCCWPAWRPRDRYGPGRRMPRRCMRLSRSASPSSSNRSIGKISPRARSSRPSSVRSRARIGGTMSPSARACRPRRGEPPEHRGRRSTASITPKLDAASQLQYRVFLDEQQLLLDRYRWRDHFYALNQARPAHRCSGHAGRQSGGADGQDARPTSASARFNPRSADSCGTCRPRPTQGNEQSILDQIQTDHRRFRRLGLVPAAP